MTPPHFSSHNDDDARPISFGHLDPGPVHKGAPSAAPGCETCIQVLHDLNNAFSGVLMNAQVMECKLPSYSRSKRYIHEIERSAQRGSALVKRLMGHLVSQSKSGNDQALCVSLPPEVDNATAVANQEPPADRGTSYAS